MTTETAKSEDVRSFEQPDSELPSLPVDDDDLLSVPNELAGSQFTEGDSGVSEREIKRKLMDIESSFLPEASPGPVVVATARGADDTYLFGGSPGSTVPLSTLPDGERETRAMVDPASGDSEQDSSIITSPPTPSDAYQTPAPRGKRAGADETPVSDVSVEFLNDTSSVDLLTSSPSAAAAQRTLARATPASGADDATVDEGQSTVGRRGDDEERAGQRTRRPASRASTIKGPPSPPADGDTENDTVQQPHAQGAPKSAELPPSMSSLLKRPSFLKNRQSSQRSSVSSFTNRSELSGDAASDVTLGADYALQTGGAAPTVAPTSRPGPGLSRLPSMTSVISSVSGLSDSSEYQDRTRTISGTSVLAGMQRADTSLSPLTEEDRGSTQSPPATPRPASNTMAAAPTDTIIAQHVQNIRVPETVAKEYREKFLQSPQKRQSSALSIGSKGRNTLTLKEQNSKIDKLSKENFDLKLKIHFLDQALQNRSDEGVKEMISKNVQLQTDLANERKETQSLRRKVRDMERKLKAQEDGQATARPVSSGSDGDHSNHSSRQAELEEEILYLREAVEHYEIQVENLKQENMVKEVEKRRLAEYIKTTGERKTSEPNSAVEEAMVRSVSHIDH